MKFCSPIRWSGGALLGVAAFVCVVGAQPAKRAMELEDIFRLKRVSEPQLSPDGKRVAYTVAEVLKDENRTNADIWIVNADPSTGSGQAAGAPRQLTNSPKRDAHPRWSPDGKWIAFESTRSGDSQIWVIAADGGEARQLTTIATGAAQANWAPDGKSVAFVSAVFPEFSERPFKESDRLNKERLDAQEKSKVKARLFDALLYRHWDGWVEGKRQHIFVVPVADAAAAGGFGGLTAGEPRDVTPGPNDAIPTSDTFTEGDEYAFSPDAKELAFTAPHHVLREQAWRTNHDIWVVDLATGAKRNVTADNPAADGQPRYSPDGKYLAYRAQRRAGFEADRWELRVLERATGKISNLTESLDQSIDAIAWGPRSDGLAFTTQVKGTAQIWVAKLEEGAALTAKTRAIVTEHANSDPAFAPDDQSVFFLRAALNHPAEVMCMKRGEGAQMITHTNDELLGMISPVKAESVTVVGAPSTGSGQAGGTPVQMWILKPPGFDASKKHPLVFWVHGGPQSAFLDSWSTRWNAQLWAAQGYVIALPNPRGSTGFGQKFCDEISGDWGGKVYEDLLACLAHLEKQPWIDPTRMAAAGASFGGYMMNWFNAHLDKFRCIVNHDGVYNFDSMYGTTEEVWFDEWDHGQPWANPEFNKFSPHRFAANFKTPTLIIHNDLDFRVPTSEGIMLFTMLQRRGIPSKLLMFPDEGHWVLKPGNSERWHQEVFAWLKAYLK
ncbi:MAG: S9 family peptidase [Verrucomicrobia bacterium]|nr:S9 family peptidase [Verrucomicrobiota bacterium]